MSHHAPATNGIFSFAGDSLFVEAAGKNLHRRATVPELREHFDASADRPAHWYEAQLIHYGLPSSRVKGTAKMRLYDAVKKGDIAVPGYMKTMEKDLKKVWKGGAAATAAKGAGATKKRKADTQTDGPAAKAPRTTKAAGRGGSAAARGGVARGLAGQGAGVEVSTPSVSAAPRGKQTAKRGGASARGGARTQTEVHSTFTPSVPVATAPRAKQMARRAGSSAAAARGGGAKREAKKQAPPPSTSPASRTKQTARRGGSAASRGGAARGVVKAEDKEKLPLTSTPRAPRAKQTARRGGSSAAAGRSSGPQDYDPHPSYPEDNDPYPYYPDDHDDPYESYPENNDGQSQSSSPVGYYDPQSDSVDPEDRITPSFNTARPLGLINGNYAIQDAPWDSPDLPDDYNSPYSLVLTLDGDRVWGSLDLGDTTGVIHLSERPYEVGPDRLGVTWRGHYTDSYGVRRFHNGNRAAPGQYLSFLGGGEIRGSVRYGYDQEDFHEFWGYRTSGQETRSPISAREMRERWEDILPGY